MAQTLFFLYWPGCLNGPKTEIPYHQKSPNAGRGIQTGSGAQVCQKADQNNIFYLFSCQHPLIIYLGLRIICLGFRAKIELPPKKSPSNIGRLPMGGRVLPMELPIKKRLNKLPPVIKLARARLLKFRPQLQFYYKERELRFLKLIKGETEHVSAHCTKWV